MVALTLNDKGNTVQALEIGAAEAIRLCAPLIVATSSGDTAVAGLSVAREKGIFDKLCIVTSVYGSRGPNNNGMKEENKKLLDESGVKIVTAAHVLSGAERAMSTKWHGVYPVEIIAHTLRMFSQGVKVAVEVGAMALDSGAIAHGVPVVAVAGTGRGADTVVVLTPAYTQDIFATKIHEILCKPY
jgi:hypothetical protein